jgi:hypothetical protein
MKGSSIQYTLFGRNIYAEPIQQEEILKVYPLGEKDILLQSVVIIFPKFFCGSLLVNE